MISHIGEIALSTRPRLPPTVSYWKQITVRLRKCWKQLWFPLLHIMWCYKLALGWNIRYSTRGKAEYRPGFSSFNFRAQHTCIHRCNFWETLGTCPLHFIISLFWSPAVSTVQKQCYTTVHRQSSSTWSKRKTAAQAEARFPEFTPSTSSWLSAVCDWLSPRSLLRSSLYKPLLPHRIGLWLDGYNAVKVLHATIIKTEGSQVFIYFWNVWVFWDNLNCPGVMIL